MSGPQWYWAQLRWGIMVEGKEGLRSWQEQVHIFPSEDRDTALQRALQIGHGQESLHKEGRRLIAKRLAQVVVLDSLGADPQAFQIELGMKKPKGHLPYEHVFNPEGTEPDYFF
jgi:hypothetical protein